jgi:hypothetical protein
MAETRPEGAHAGENTERNEAVVSQRVTEKKERRRKPTTFFLLQPRILRMERIYSG